MILAKVPDGLSETKLEDFAKTTVGLLKAFVLSRVLDNACSREKDKQMPNKGSLAQSQNGNVCPKTKKPLLIWWAFELRNEPITAKIVDCPVVDQDELDLTLFENEVGPTQLAICTEDVIGEVLAKNNGNLEEVLDDEGRDVDDEVEPQQKDDSDASDESSVDSDDESGK